MSTWNMGKSVYEMGRDEFIKELSERVPPHQVLNYASDIYGFLSGLFMQDILDSTIREWAFQWASEELKIDYDEIYERWLA